MSDESFSVSNKPNIPSKMHIEIMLKINSNSYSICQSNLHEFEVNVRQYHDPSIIKATSNQGHHCFLTGVAMKNT